MERPIWDMLQAVAARLSLHMPAARGEAPFGGWDAYRLDTTELAVTDDLYAPTGAIARAQALAAQSAGIAHTLLLHGGSTAGIQAMVLYAARRGETVILPRNAHLSALNACAIAGIEPVFAEPSYTAYGRVFTRNGAYLQAMQKHPGAKAVLVLRPDYYGLTPDFALVAEQARGQGMLVLCDEAHGATFNWRADIKNAGAMGAQLFVQSAHKTLPALTAGAWLHASREIDVERLRRILRMVQTSSPSFVGMASLDDARAWMDRGGTEACAALAKDVARFYRRASGLGYAPGQGSAPAGFVYDCLRLVLDAPQGGYELEAALREKGIDVEMADETCIVCILSLLNGATQLDGLAQALEEMGTPHRKEKERRPSAKVLAPPREQPQRVMTIGEAAFSPCEAVPMGEAVGRVSAANVGLYPPGVALCTAGECFSQEMVTFLCNTPGKLFGLPYAGHLLCAII